MRSVCRVPNLNINELPGLLATLVDHSLVKVISDSAVESRRYRLLFSVREYARQRLSPGVGGELSRRHAEFLLRVAEEKGPHIQEVGGHSLRADLNLEADNLYEALTWTTKEQDRSELGLRFAAALWLYWLRAGQGRVARHWLETTLERADSSSTKLRAIALHGFGATLRSQGDYEGARRNLEESVALWRVIDDPVGLGTALNRLGAVMTNLGDLSEAKRLIRESLSVLRHADCTWEAAIALKDLGEIAWIQQRLTDAASLFEKSADILKNLADPWLAVLPLDRLATMAADQGQYERAEAHWRQCLNLHQSLEDNHLLSNAVGGLARVAFERNDDLRAARLAGMVDSMREKSEGPPPTDHEALLTELRARLGNDVFQTQYAGGKDLSSEHALTDVLAESGRTADPAKS